MQWLQVLLSSILLTYIQSLSDIKYSNQWSVQIDGGKEEADRLAKKHGFVNEGKVIHNYYSFHHHKVERVSKLPSSHRHEGLAEEPSVKMVKQQLMKSYKLLSTSASMNINDRRWGEMWYIENKDGGATYNVIDVWKKGITGQGVVVAVVDEGFDPSHPEIQANYDPSASFDFIENDESPLSMNKSVPQYGHAENCAGVIAAVLNNSNCGVGLAYKAKLGGIRLFFDKMATDAQEAKALSFNKDHIHIYSNSWGPDDKGFEVVGPDTLTQLALKDGAEKGRGGLGSIFVFAAGNGGIIVEDSCAFNGYVNNIHTIAITGINRDGSIPGYGEHCAGIMAVAYSRDVFGDSNPVITAGTKGTCVKQFGGSSAAAAMASGLIALMLNANPMLSWRDVQHIIVRSARHSPVKGVPEGHWTENKAGFKVNDYVGFGLMDARRMVELASSWTTVPEKVTCTIPRLAVKKPIPSTDVLEEWIDLSVMSAHCGGVVINYLEQVEVKVNLNYSRRGDLLIKITSPEGTVSNLTHYRMSDSFFKLKDLNWVLMTLHLWGERAVGKWKLSLENSQTKHPNTGILFDWTLILHGTTSDPYVPVPGMSWPTRKLRPSRLPAGEIPTSIITNRKERATNVAGLGVKQTIGIIVGCVAVVVLALFIAVYLRWKKISKPRPTGV